MAVSEKTKGPRSCGMLAMGSSSTDEKVELERNYWHHIYCKEQGKTLTRTVRVLSARASFAAPCRV